MARQRRSKTSQARSSAKTRFWYIGKRNKNNEILWLLIVGTLVGGGAWGSLSSSSQTLVIVFAIFIVSVIFIGTFAFVGYKLYYQRQKLRVLSAAQVDEMDGIKFEQYVAALLQYQGYSYIQVTKASGDFGVDVLASKQNQHWAIQTKRFVGAVGVEAVQEVSAGCAYYHCQRSMVVTTSTFTPAAKQLAARNHVLLIDRDKLAEWILTFQRGKAKYSGFARS